MDITQCVKCFPPRAENTSWATRLRRVGRKGEPAVENSITTGTY